MHYGVLVWGFFVIKAASPLMENEYRGKEIVPSVYASEGVENANYFHSFSMA